MYIYNQNFQVMKLSYFLLVSFLVLVPTELRGGVSGERAENIGRSKKADAYMSNVCYKNKYGDDHCNRTSCQLPVKVRYSLSDEEKCIEGRKMRIKDELSRREVETVKDAAVKWQSSVAEKNKRECGPVCDTIEKEVKVDYPRGDYKFDSNSKKGHVLCAECDECELQVTATGDGVLLKCKGCHQVPAEEVIFPGGNNRIIRLP